MGISLPQELVALALHGDMARTVSRGVRVCGVQEYRRKGSFSSPA